MAKKLLTSILLSALCAISFADENVDINKYANFSWQEHKRPDSPYSMGDDQDFSAITGKEFSGTGFAYPSKGFIAVGGKYRNGFTNDVKVKFNSSKPAKTLELLHASYLWHSKNPAEIEVRFTDGKPLKIVMENKVDAVDFKGYNSNKNAQRVIIAPKFGGNKLVFSRSIFALPQDRVPTEAVFRCKNPGSGWFIAGIKLTDEIGKLQKEKSVKLVVNEKNNWVPVERKFRTNPGSMLDFSYMLDAPAGKYGRVVARKDGSLTFENAPDKTLRIIGINLCGSANIPTHRQAEQLADELARQGYNSVRFHHHDNGLVDPAAADTVTINKEALDRMEYLFWQLKKRGIYITTDFYTSRKIYKGKNIRHRNIKTDFVLKKEARDNWKAFAKNWFSHKNPYTGMTWAEDPAIIMVNLVNEDNIDSGFWGATPEQRKIFRKLFSKYLKKHKGKDKRVDTTNPLMRQMLVELQSESHLDMKKFVREEIKYNGLLASNNNETRPTLTPLRDLLDLADVHKYYHHPKFIGVAWSKKSSSHYGTASPIAELAETPREIMPTRIYGKPFFCTEYNYCFPNGYRGVAGALMGAYIAYQGHDAYYRFCYSHNIKRAFEMTTHIGSFETASECLQQLNDRISTLLFVRGDVKPAKDAYSIAVDAKVPDMQLYLLRYQSLGLLAKIGSHISGKELMPGVKSIGDGRDYSKAGKLAESWKQIEETGKATTPDGQISLDSKANTFVVKTAKSEAVALPKGKLTSKVLTVENASGFQTVTIHSMDDRELENSGKILMMHLTNYANRNYTVMLQGDRMHKKSNGSNKPMVKRETAKITLRLKGAKPTVTALSPEGYELGKVEVTGSVKDGWSFKVDPGAFKGGVMAYSIIR